MFTDTSEIIGVYPICNTGAILIHQIDYVEDKLLVSINGLNKESVDITEQQIDGEDVTGFVYHDMFVPLHEVMKFA